MCGDDGDSVRTDYNVPFSNSFSVDEIMRKMEQITAETNVCFKVLFSVGKILYHVTKKRFRYYIPFDNASLLDKSLFVTKPADLANVRQSLMTVDPASYLNANRPNTKHICVLATNVVITVFETFYPMGRLHANLPNYLVNHKSLLTLQNYNDNLCFFRCLSMFKFKCVREGYVRFLYRRWMENCVENGILSNPVCWQDYEGVTLQDLPYLEKLFKTNVQIYCLNEDKSVNIIYRTMNQYKKTMYLNEYEGHLSFITKFSIYAKKFVCSDCDYITGRHDYFKAHLRNCSTVRKVKIGSGYYANPLTIFEQMDEVGVNIPEKLRYISQFATFDFESLLLSHQEQISHATKILQVHKPLSFSIISNVEGYTEPIFVVNQDSEKLIDSFYEIICSIQKKYSSDRQKEYRIYLDILQEKIDYWKPPKINKRKDKGGCAEEEECGEGMREEEEEEEEAEEVEEGENDVSSQCGESNYCEPPSKQFLEAMSRPNPWNNFMHNLVHNDRWEVNYNQDNSQNSSESLLDGIGSDMRSTLDDESNSYDCPIRDQQISVHGMENEHDTDSLPSDDSWDGYNHSSCSSLNSIRNSNQVMECDSNANHGDFMGRQPVSSEDLDSNYSLPINDICEGSEEIENIEQLRVPRNLIKYQKIMYKKFVHLYNELNKFVNTLTLVSFNSSKYDLKLVQNLLFLKFDPVTLKVIKKNNKFLCISTPEFKFLDIINFLSPNVNYASFVRAFATDSTSVEENKLYYPYGTLSSYDKLLQPNLPPMDHEDWYSKLKGGSVLDDSESGRTIQQNYDLMQKVWEDNRCENMLSYLKIYNNNDVIPFLSSVETILSRYRERGLCLFSRCVSGPGISKILMYDYSAKEGCYFALPGQRNASLQKTLLSGIIGGNSCVYRRYAKVNETCVWGHNSEKLTKAIVGYDCTSLYGGILAGPMPCGSFCRRFKKDNYKISVRHDLYTLQYQYIEYMGRKLGRKALHKQSRGREVYIGALRPDGILLPAERNQKTLIIEIFGCYSHHHLCYKTIHCRKNKVWMENVKKNSNEWELKEAYYEKLGYDVLFIRECQLDEIYNTEEEYRNLVKSKRPNFARLHPGQVTEKQIIDGILNDELFAMLVCDISLPEDWSPELKAKLHCPQHLSPRQFWDVLPPVYGNCELKYPDHWSPIMQKYAEENSISTHTRTLLVAGVEAEQLPITSGYAKFLLTHGFQLSNISEICEYTPKRAFKKFVDERTGWRRMADKEPKMKILASQGKIEVNQGYGVSLSNSAKWTDIKYVSGVRAASREVNDRLFIKLQNINCKHELFEVEKQKRIIQYKFATQIGFWILWESKRHILQFYFDYLLRFINFDDISTIFQDTDSLYLNLSQYTFEACIKEEMKSFFTYLTKGRCVKITNIVYLEHDEDTYFPRSCCDLCKMADSRSPLLFHLEASGSEVFALCSKTYALRDEKENENELSVVKYSCKGQTRSNVKLDGSQYIEAYYGQKPVSAPNFGFQFRGQRGGESQMVTYETIKQNFQMLYLKRRVLDCSCCTVALDIVIKPKNVTL